MARILAVCGFLLTASLAGGETPAIFAKPMLNKPDEPLARAVTLDRTAAFPSWAAGLRGR